MMMHLLRSTPSVVMAGLDPAIHGFVCVRSFTLREGVDARVKPGHDGFLDQIQL